MTNVAPSQATPNGAGEVHHPAVRSKAAVTAAKTAGTAGTANPAAKRERTLAVPVVSGEISDDASPEIPQQDPTEELPPAKVVVLAPGGKTARAGRARDPTPPPLNEGDFTSATPIADDGEISPELIEDLFGGVLRSIEKAEIFAPDTPLSYYGPNGRSDLRLSIEGIKWCVSKRDGNWKSERDWNKVIFAQTDVKRKSSLVSGFFQKAPNAPGGKPNPFARRKAS